MRALRNGIDLDLRDGAGGVYFDAAGRAELWQHKDTLQAGSPVAVGFEYRYDAAGNKLMQRALHDPLDDQRYAYDSVGRLTAMSRGPVPGSGAAELKNRGRYNGCLPLRFGVQGVQGRVQGTPHLIGAPSCRFSLSNCAMLWWRVR